MHGTGPAPSILPDFITLYEQHLIIKLLIMLFSSTPLILLISITNECVNTLSAVAQMQHLSVQMVRDEACLILFLTKSL